MTRKSKYPRFSGGLGPDCLPVEEWVEEVHHCLQARHMAPSEQAYFLYDLRHGEAKMEIKLCPATDRVDPEKIFFNTIGDFCLRALQYRGPTEVYSMLPMGPHAEEGRRQKS